ncbi:MAG: F0F1 ATP synthase subunit delta [Dysgonamonadaceae bacterium]|nr:F0F1 ATP synthase subunit delta [Dysgonamonadaceae bacterium]
MEVGILSMRYAKALIEFAQEKKAEDTLYRELGVLAHSFRTQPTLTETIDNPIISAEDKFSLICVAACGNAKPSAELAGFIRLVLKHNRESYLHFMCLMYLDLYRKLKHIGVGQLITAVPVDEKVRNRMTLAASRFLHSKMELKTVVDPSIEGGFIFDINDYRLDASIATQLRQMKQQFIDKNRRII